MMPENFSRPLACKRVLSYAKVCGGKWPGIEASQWEKLLAGSTFDGKYPFPDPG
jgi:hypothetical protein